MKKLYLILVLIVGAVGGNAAATATPSITPSFTMTPTFTPTPIAIYSSAYVRNYIQPNTFLQADGVTVLGASAVFGPDSYLLQYLSQTAAALGTNTAKVRVNWTIPADFAPFNSRGMGYLVPYIVAVHSVTNTAVPVVVDLTRMAFNQVTGNATTVYSGTYQTLTARTNNPLKGFTVSRVPLVLPASLTQTTLVPGDQISLTIERQTTVAAGILRIIRFEWEYQNTPYLKP